MTKQKFTDEQLIREWEKKLSQENIAENLGVSSFPVHVRMKKLGLKPWYKIEYDPVEVRNRDRRILYAIAGHPGTYRDIAQRTGVTENNLFTTSKDRLKRQHKVLVVEMNIASNFYGGHESVDGIAGLTIYYCPGDEQLLGSYITSYLPREISLGLRISLTQRLKYLPKKTFYIVRQYILTHTVK